MRFTVLGGTGFIGARLVAGLRADDHDVFVPERDWIPSTEDLGHVIYAIGLTGDFRSQPYATVAAHVTKLSSLLQRARFRSWLYLSTSRVYGAGASDEDAEILVRPSADSVYDLSKLLGEALCLSHENPSVRAVRLSNVFGDGMGTTNFLGSVIDSVRQTGGVTIGEAATSSKDYVPVEDVVQVMAQIAASGSHRLYNVASGEAVTHASVAAILQSTMGADVTFAAGGPSRPLPPINIARVQAEFPSFAPGPIEVRLRSFLA